MYKGDNKMININNDICKSVALISEVSEICYLSKLAVNNDYELEFHFKNFSFRLNKNDSNNSSLLLPNYIRQITV